MFYIFYTRSFSAICVRLRLRRKQHSSFSSRTSIQFSSRYSIQYIMGVSYLFEEQHDMSSFHSSFCFCDKFLHIHRQRKRRGAWDSSQHTQNDYRSSTCVVFTLFSQQKASRRCWFGRLFGLWSRLVLVLYLHRQRQRQGQGAWDSSHHTQETGIIEQHMRGIYIIFSTKKALQTFLFARPFVWCGGWWL